MRRLFTSLSARNIMMTFIIILASLPVEAQQDLKLGIHADPIISWFSSDVREVRNKGARPGFNFGLTLNKYFTPNYSISTGLNIINAGGRVVSSDTTIMDFTNFDSRVLPGNAVIYKIQYLSVPIGIKLQTNEIGYISFFTDLGLDPKVVIGGKADIPSLDIKGEKATSELRMFNMSYHVTAGIDYSLGGSTALVLGLSFDNNFFDITTDLGDQPNDKISHKILSFRLGLIF